MFSILFLSQANILIRNNLQWIQATQYTRLKPNSAKKLKNQIKFKDTITETKLSVIYVFEVQELQACLLLLCINNTNNVERPEVIF